MAKEIVIDYGEQLVADNLLWILKNKNNEFKDYSIYVPISRQQKGIDLILFKNGCSKVATIQVKSSRSYVGDKDKDSKERINYLWLNTFSIREEAMADFYIIVGNYYSSKQKLDQNSGCVFNLVDYKSLILVYTADEMKEELIRLKQVKTESQNRFFSFRFRDETDVELDRGYFAGYNTICLLYTSDAADE